MSVFVMNNTESSDTTPCAKCGKPTALRILMPSFKRGFEERLFECPGCGHAETVFIRQPLAP
jgi:transcription elongation factor Elf1